MCTYSMVIDWGARQPEQTWDQQKFDEFAEALRKAHAIDVFTGQPNCEDPEKAALLKRIEERLGIVESRLNKLDAAAEEARERAEYERLKAKFEPLVPKIEPPSAGHA